MLDIAQDFKFEEFPFVLDDINKDINKLYEYAVFEKELKLYINKIENVKDALEKEKVYIREYEKNLQDYDKLKNDKANLDSKIDKAREYFNTLKDEFIDRFQQFDADNTYLKIPEDVKFKIFEYVNNYNEPYTYDDIKQYVRQVQNSLSDKYRNEVLMLENSIQAKIEEIEQNSKEIQEWKQKKEPEPVRSESVISNREMLAKNGITFMPLYNLIDFKKNVDDNVKNNIESALLDSGLLDALVIPKMN